MSSSMVVREETGRRRGRAGVELFWREWLPGETGGARPGAAGGGLPAPRGTVILLVHGAGEHSGRYGDLGTYFASRGVPVLAYDARGLGRSGGTPGHVDRFEDYVEDVLAFREMALERHPGARVVLVGHSMGGLVVLATALERPGAFAAVVASGPLLGIAAEVPKWKVALGRAVVKVAPKLTMTSAFDPSLLARNPAVGRRYSEDPYVLWRQGAKVTTRWFIEINRGMTETMARARELKTPVFILQGTADRVVSPDAAKAFFDALGDIPKAFRFLEGFYHELFQEDERGTVFAEIERWLEGLGLLA
ncbi:MAG: lysophospholipase [Firmicutes bacterium]|nr:lysophospholipase [Bacillota bacterium]